MSILTKTEFIAHKTARTHPRINVAVEFICDLGDKTHFAPERGLPVKNYEREHLLYIDRETYYDMGLPDMITVSIVPGDALNEEY